MREFRCGNKVPLKFGVFEGFAVHMSIVCGVWGVEFGFLSAAVYKAQDA